MAIKHDLRNMTPFLNEELCYQQNAVVRWQCIQTQLSSHRQTLEESTRNKFEECLCAVFRGSQPLSNRSCLEVCSHCWLSLTLITSYTTLRMRSALTSVAMISSKNEFLAMLPVQPSATVSMCPPLLCVVHHGRSNSHSKSPQQRVLPLLCITVVQPLSRKSRFMQLLPLIEEMKIVYCACSGKM